MRFRGGGVGHNSTREATNRFLNDRDRLDMSVPDGEFDIAGINKGPDGSGEGNEDLNGGNEASDVEVHRDDEVEGGGEGDREEQGILGDGFGGLNEDDEDYGYDDPVDDDNNSDPEPDFADDALGPEDGEGEGDEMYLLGFAAL
jgi:hypothetical protein